MRAWAIRHIPTGRYMPAQMTRYARGGWSHWDPSAAPGEEGGGYGLGGPRLFYNEASAPKALTAWLMGKHTRETGEGYDPLGHGDAGYDEHHVEPVQTRHRHEMEIVEVEVRGL